MSKIKRVILIIATIIAMLTTVVIFIVNKFDLFKKEEIGLSQISSVSSEASLKPITVSYVLDLDYYKESGTLDLNAFNAKINALKNQGFKGTVEYTVTDKDGKISEKKTMTLN